MDNVIAGTYLASQIEYWVVCALSVSVINSWVTGTKPPHCPRTASPPPVRHVNPYGNLLSALRKSSLQLSAAHSASAALNESRVSHSSRCWNGSAPGGCEWTVAVLCKRALPVNGPLDWGCFCRNLRASLPQFYLHVAAFTSTQHFSLKGKFMYLGLLCFMLSAVKCK